MSTTPEQDVSVEYRGRIAIITLDRQHKLNALDADRYFQLAKLMHEVASHDEVFITIVTGKGRYFSAGADVGISRDNDPNEDPRRASLKSFVSNNLHITHAFYSHPKILVFALNGPAVGLSAAIVAHADFVYAAPHAFLLTPFSSLGLVAEGNASLAFVQRLGISKANEALIMSKRLTIDELVHVGFVNKVFDTNKDSDKFLAKVIEEVNDRMGTHLVPDSMTKTKALIRRPYNDLHDAQGVHEVFGGLQRFLSGVPQEEFRKIASGEKKHKL
ncbi:ClpP/crotonase [Eremomyces bilateralis CBS 781.70]|uniref:ClpP/crotonase n=1 Tax=Eremomyces bilateralis CBS 781.70 TaxID=1392243 RepID=A0A6G1FX28_9PEZI|nr:ClpP/crotonase [Eremomyces bilateralis CBS 781.70]KAF1810298.1 ClpP/crotonase [Eremomyces bilateralis CBS 781.70]